METINDVCSYNKGIECFMHIKCNTCGWNPEISKKRIDKLRRERRTYNPKKTLEVFKYPARNL